MSSSSPGTTWPPVDVQRPQRHPNAPAPGTELGEHYPGCFACGNAVPGGLRLRTVVGEGLHATARFLVDRQHQGAPGLAHGGVLTAAFDEALGTLCVLLQRPAVTGKLETDFVRPVPVGSTLYINAAIDGMDGRKIYSHADGRLDAPDGPLALRARALFVTVGLEHFRTHGDMPPAATGDGVEINP